MGMTMAVVLPTIFTCQVRRHRGLHGARPGVPPDRACCSACRRCSGPGPSVHPPVIHAERNAFIAFFAPLKNRLFRRLLLVFVVNGSALGVAVTVMLFYVEHVLKGSKLQAGIILLVYFIAGAAQRADVADAVASVRARPPPGSSA